VRTGALQRGGATVLPRVWRAERWHQRLRGLLLRQPLQPGEGLLIEPCDSVHTLGMAYPLDLLFLDREGRVLGWREGLKPWRGAWCRGARMTLEMPVGSLTRLAPVLGQTFRWQPLPLDATTPMETPA